MHHTIDLAAKIPALALDLAHPLVSVLDLPRKHVRVFDVTGTLAVLDGIDFGAFIQNLLFCRYYISVTLTDRILRMVNKREFAIKEFRESEAKHAPFLRGFEIASAPIMSILNLPPTKCGKLEPQFPEFSRTFTETWGKHLRMFCTRCGCMSSINMFTRW
jgi:hypothetical protein